MGIHELLYRSISKLEIDIRSDFYFNSVLSGASTLFPGNDQYRRGSILSTDYPPGIPSKHDMMSALVH